MDVDLRDLELLDALGHHKTLTAAAQHLYVSQPALSQRLGRLEERLATPLFERQGRRLVANPAGRRMLRAARAMLAELRTAESDVRDLVADRRQPVRLASQCSTNYQWLPPILRMFRDRSPGADIHVQTVPDDDLINALLDDRLDVALVSKLDRQMDRVRLRRMFDDELVAVVAADHPWAQRRHVTADDFADVHLVLFDSYDPQREPAVPLPLPTGARPTRLTTLPVGADLLVEMVAGGDSVTVLPSWIVAPFLRTHAVTTVPVGRPALARTWYCATRHGERSEVVDILTDLIVDHFDRGQPILD